MFNRLQIKTINIHLRNSNLIFLMFSLLLVSKVKCLGQHNYKESKYI